MNLFLTLEQILEDYIKISWDEFIASDLFKKALAVHRLPLDLMNDLEAKIKEEEKDEAEYEKKVAIRFKEDDEIKVFTDPLSPTIDIDPNNKVVESNLRKFEMTIEETEKEAEREKQFSRKHSSKSISEIGDITNSPSILSILGTSGTSTSSTSSSSSESDLSIGTSMPKLENFDMSFFFVFCLRVAIFFTRL